MAASLMSFTPTVRSEPNAVRPVPPKESAEEGEAWQYSKETDVIAPNGRTRGTRESCKRLERGQTLVATWRQCTSRRGLNGKSLESDTAGREAAVGRETHRSERQCARPGPGSRGSGEGSPG